MKKVDMYDDSNPPPPPHGDSFSGTHDGFGGDTMDDLSVTDMDIEVDWNMKEIQEEESLLSNFVVGTLDSNVKDGKLAVPPMGNPSAVEGTEESWNEELSLVATEEGSKGDIAIGAHSSSRIDPIFRSLNKNHTETSDIETKSGFFEDEGKDKGSIAALKSLDIAAVEEPNPKEYSELTVKEIQANNQRKYRADEWQVVPIETTMTANDPSFVQGGGTDMEEFDFDSDDDDNGTSGVPLNRVVAIAKPFNLELMNYCIEMGKASASLVEGKDVVLIVGKTGTGKSTLVQGIAGKHMKKCSYELDAVGKDVFEADDPVPGFEIGHAKSSMTKHIKCLFREGRANSNFAYLDTPGFDDTDGEEVDVATAVMLNHVAMKCRSLRFVVVIHYVSLLEDRGGAMRGILKFVRNFVPDFNDHKQSFMFLFSHADEISGVPETLEGAKHHLLNEIVMTIEGTQSVEVKSVLHYMRKSLEKGFPFVDVMHPMKSNFLSLASSIERKLKPVNEPSRSARCFLTPSSQLRLNGAVEKLLTDMRILLGRDNIDLNKIQQIQATFRTFDLYIDFGDVRRTSNDCKELLEQYTNRLQHSIEGEIAKGTAVNHQFSTRNVEILKVNIRCLAVLGDNFSIQSISDMIVRRVRTFQKGMFIDADHSFDDIDKKLYRLQVWNQFDPNMQCLLDEVIVHLEALIKSHIGELKKHWDDLESCEFELLAGNLKALKSLNENSKVLCTLLPFVSDACKMYVEFLAKLQSVITGWSTETLSLIELLEFNNKQSAEPLVSIIRKIEAAQPLVRDSCGQEDGPHAEEKIISDVESLILDKFKDNCFVLKDSVHCIDEGWVTPMTKCKDIMDSILSLQDRGWQAILPIYLSVIETIKSLLRTKSGELDHMSQSALNHNVYDGKRDGEALACFAKCLWFDDFLPAEERFLESCISKVNNRYASIFSNAEGSFGAVLMNLSHQSSHSPYTEDLIGGTDELRNLFLRANHCWEFGKIVKDQTILRGMSQLRSSLNSHVKLRAKKGGEDARLWGKSVRKSDPDFDQVTVLTENLDLILREMEIFIQTDLGKKMQELVLSARSEIIGSLTTFRANAQKIFEADVDYHKIAVLVKKVEAMGSFPHTSPHLPNMEGLKQTTRMCISSHVKRIEDLVEETSEFDAIDKHLMELEKAKVLDSFVSHDLTSRLRSLQRLHSEKEEKADELVKEMIANSSFNDIRDFLIPLAESKDQIRKQKFNQAIKQICDSLKETDKKLSSNLYGVLTEEKANNIAKSITILEAASDAGGIYLEKEFNAQVAAKKAKETLTRRLNNLLFRMTTAARKADFVECGDLNVRLGLYDTYLKDFLISLCKEKIVSAMDLYSNLKTSVSIRLEKYFNSSFVEYREIGEALSGLKAGKEMNVTDLVELYSETRKVFEDNIRTTIRSIQDSANTTRCYDDAIDIFQNLNKSLETGLKAHLPQSLVSDCNRMLQSWTKSKETLESELDFNNGSEVLKLKTWLETMDTLNPSAAGFLLFPRGLYQGRKATATYNNLKEKLENEVSLRYSRGQKAVTISNFVSLNECITFLGLVDEIVGKHIKSASGAFQRLKAVACDNFVTLCHSCHEALQSDNCKDFMPLFTDFRSSVLNITCITENGKTEQAFKLTNQLLFERIERDIASFEKSLCSFDFLSTRQKVENLRDFGGFIADRYSILHEELKSCDHFRECDPWLDKLQSLIINHFHAGRDLERLRLHSIIGTHPSSSIKEIELAFHRKSLEVRSIKDSAIESLAANAKLLQIKEAFEELKKGEGNLQSSRCSRPFDSELRSIGEELRNVVRKSLKEQSYSEVETFLFKVQGIDILEQLVLPPLDSTKIRNDIFRLVKAHVEKVRVEVDTSWSERKYQNLNHNISDLRMMEEAFKSYSDVFPSSWNTGIVEKVEDEIDKLGNRCREFLTEDTVANTRRDEFRQCFLRMGSVLVELALFKEHTRKVMSDVLESCLSSDWGYAFLFELGLSLQKGDDASSEEEVRVAQTLVTEFKHFKEVLTMIWNEETIQKPPEDTVKDIRGEDLSNGTVHAGPLTFDQDELLDKFYEFESKYTEFLGEYLKPASDLKKLSATTKAFAESLKPISCDRGFDDEVKAAIPTIMASVFALFTILKSGESYNRLDDAAGGCSIDSKKLLRKPHNIQVLTLLCMLGCGVNDSSSLKSQLLQIRTGEGKSMILGAAAAIFGLLGFRIRCVCYSEYLSNRDYELFREVFQYFDLIGSVKYCKITTLSEETTAAKGNIRDLTLALMYGRLAANKSSGGLNAVSAIQPQSVNPTPSDLREEILLVDEVDVFFGSEFYGHTYNQATQLREPEVADLLRYIWNTNKQQAARKLRLGDIKVLPEFQQLIHKIPGFESVLENEVALMLDQVRRVDDEPHYHLDHNDRIGYRVLDAISYDVTFGYRTVFAYLKEAGDGNLKDPVATLSRVLVMPISCGQFSYANISPTRILGVSGTLEVMGHHEKKVLQKYGVSRYLYVPSVYGQSNFTFDRAGDGVSIEKGASDFFHKITEEISDVARDKKRAVIVFFKDSSRLDAYVASPFFRKLGRKKEILTEKRTAADKEFAISKAATTGQITLATAVFGRGTDFFCKDDTLQTSGGVHVVQAFLSSDISEEIQIQGRTARQGKKGTYKLILLDEDLEADFGIARGSSDNWQRQYCYSKLCEAREKSHENHWQAVEMNLSKAKAKDESTHKYFDSLLKGDVGHARILLKDLYENMKKRHTGTMTLDLAFAIDITGSMGPYGKVIGSTVQSLLEGSNSVLSKLQVRFAETKFRLRMAVLGYRDIDDGAKQFAECTWNGTSHFSENSAEVIRQVKALVSSTSGGGDVAEDHLGAIQRCSDWKSEGDWEGTIKAILLLTDAPAHGSIPIGATSQNLDSYGVRHPSGLSIDSVSDTLLQKDIDVFICSFDPYATSKFEEDLSEVYNDHTSNTEGREITVVPLNSAPISQGPTKLGGTSNHIIFVLDESGSMQYNWSGVVVAYNNYMASRRQQQFESDIVSVVQFNHTASVTVHLENILKAPTSLGYNGGGTSFAPAAASAAYLARMTPASHVPVVVFMSDGMADDSADAAATFRALNRDLVSRSGDELDLNVVGFGGGTDTRQLLEIANASRNGRVHSTSDVNDLSKTFIQIAGGNNVAHVLEAEIGRRISDAVTNRLAAEYLG
jgi:energy-coupling factor transporter ATP-binding protein EcfA2